MKKTLLYQLELDQSIVDCGMSYVIQLMDGRFIIIDGGYFTDGEDERLYHFLASRSEKEICIAGWFFSHAHQDHVGNFINFTKQYLDKVTVQKLYYNVQPIDLSDAIGDWKSSDPATVKEFYNVIETYYTEDQIHILHTNEIVKIGEATFEVLYTQENLYPEIATFNDYSVVLMMEVEGQKILWLGDIYKRGCEYLLENQYDKLSCEMVQVSHHGYAGATSELYNRLGAKVALWPTPDYRTERILNNEVSSQLIYSTTIKEHIVSGNGTAELSLPYEVNTAKLLPRI
ncbi:MAG: ComEC/Rec2 family competence protein [Cellulosilyticaceae bacterium]